MSDDLTDRVERLEAEVARLVSASPTVADRPGTRPVDVDPATFWALTGLRERLPEPGGVLFTGTVTLPTGEHVEWQEGRATDALLDEDWAGPADTLGALGHPVRLAVLRAVLGGVRSTAALAELEGIGTPGQLHHHLRPLLAAGWLRTVGRGRYEVPATRVVRLLTVLAAGSPS